MTGSRLRDHGTGDLALTGLTLSAAAVAAGVVVTRWVTGRFRRHDDLSPPSAGRRGGRRGQ